MKWDYGTVHTYEHSGGAGYIVWRVGTGGNVELLDLQVVPTARGQGVGIGLLRAMLRHLKDNPPYYTIFGFTRTANVEAQEFYAAVGFDLSRVAGVYADGEAIVFSAKYDDLCKRHLS